MTEYPYRRELKAPGGLSRIDFGSPALAPALRMTIGNLQKETRAFRPPAGLRFYKKMIPHDAGETECFVLEAEAGGKMPALLYCHGGGFFLPLQASTLRIASYYARALGARVYLPEYRLIPAHPAPAAFFDCLAVYEAIQKEMDGGEKGCLLYGESAGGTLAAGLAQWMRDKGLPPAAGQVLIYPALDDLRGEYPSRALYRDAAWTERSNEYMWRGYLRDGCGTMEPYLIPLCAQAFDGLPPAYIEPQEIDILRDEAVAYAQKLRGAGTPVQLELIRGSYHGFDTDTENPFVKTVLEQRVHAMKEMLIKPSI